MRKGSFQLIRIALNVLAFFVVFYPIIVWYRNTGLELGSLTAINVFPVLGLTAFSLMWLHIVGGVFGNTLERYVNFRKFVSTTSLIVLVLLVFHPLLFLVNLTKRQIINLLTVGRSIYIWFAITAWIVFIGYDIAKLFKDHKFLTKHWEIIKLISTLPFFLVFFHSLKLGSDLQKGTLRYLWIFYGITATFATLYTYIIKRFFKKRTL